MEKFTYIPQTSTMSLRLCRVNSEEQKQVSNALGFLYAKGARGKGAFMKSVSLVYGSAPRLDLLCDNGRNPYYTKVKWREEDEWCKTIVLFKGQDLTQHAVEVLGHTFSEDFPYYYGIGITDRGREALLMSFTDVGVPNWNTEYHTKRTIRLSEVNFPVLREGSGVAELDIHLHEYLNAMEMGKREPFTESASGVSMLVKDQFGYYKTIDGASWDVVFREYADHYTGYRNYRRQMASEWEIVDPSLRGRFDEWKKGASGLKSDFDKFYGSGIVD